MSEPAANTAVRLGLMGCPHCDLVLRADAAGRDDVVNCPRCGGRVSARHRASLQRCWALILCAAVCYVPANVLPILTVVHFGAGEPDTIMSGVVHLFAEGQWPIAVLVFVASIFVPLAKIMIIVALLLSIHGRMRAWPRERTRMFHVIDALGRWSMIDVFMISILVALVQLGTIATVEPGPGAAYFGVVVVCTMLAAIAFDPRLIWDAIDER